MEPEASLPCSQEPATGPYPESDESNPHVSLCLFIFNILPSTPGFQVVSSSQVFRPKFYTHFSPPSHVLHAPPISSFLIWPS
jgi:hypothetical protein